MSGERALMRRCGGYLITHHSVAATAPHFSVFSIVVRYLSSALALWILHTPNFCVLSFRSLTIFSYCILSLRSFIAFTLRAVIAEFL